MRKLVNRFLPDDIRELGMWSMALLINTSTWKEMLENWRLVCLVFLNIKRGEDTTESKRNHSKLLSKIGSITNDPNANRAIQDSKSIIKDNPDVFTFDDESTLPTLSVIGTAHTGEKKERKTPSLSRIDRLVTSAPTKKHVDFVFH